MADITWNTNSAGYLTATIKQKSWLQHRYVWTQHHGPIAKGTCIHHINGIKTDNRIENLTTVSYQGNMQKMDKAGKGYSFLKSRNKYQALRRINGKTTFLGYFMTACGAYLATRMAYITHA